MKTMKIILKRAGQKPEVKEISGTLKSFQEIVGGYIECINITDNILCICNEEGKLMNLPSNIILNGDIIVGDIFFIASRKDDFDSLSDKQIELIMNRLGEYKLTQN